MDTSSRTLDPSRQSGSEPQNLEGGGKREREKEKERREDRGVEEFYKDPLL